MKPFMSRGSSRAWAFLVDENTTASLADALRASGFVADHVYDVGLQGHADPDIFAYAQAQRRILITGDLGFGNITRYPPPHHGIIVLRIPDTASTAELIQEVLDTLTGLAGQNLEDSLVIVQKGRFRVRR